MHFVTRNAKEAKRYFRNQVKNAKVHDTGVAFLEKGNGTKYGTIHTKRGLVSKAWSTRFHIELMAAIVNGNAEGINTRGPGYRTLMDYIRKSRLENA